MQMKRRKRARELPACLQETSTPYLTTIHASRNYIHLSEPQRIVRPVCQSVFTHKPKNPIGRGKKRTRKGILYKSKLWEKQAGALLIQSYISHEFTHSLPTLGFIKQVHPNSVNVQSMTCRTQSCGSGQCAAARACDI